MADIFKGIAAGVVATTLLSLIMLAKSMLGLPGRFDMIEMLTIMLGVRDNPAVGWILHFVIGALLWGGLFAWLEPRLPGDRHPKRGIVFGILAWLVLMIVLMPMSGAGLFALQIGAAAPLITLALHVFYGAILGWVYGMLAPTNDPFATRDHHTTA